MVREKSKNSFETTEPIMSASAGLLMKSALKGGGLKNSGNSFFYGKPFCTYQRPGSVHMELRTQHEQFRSNVEMCGSRMYRKIKSPAEGSKPRVSAQVLQGPFVLDS